MKKRFIHIASLTFFACCVAMGLNSCIRDDVDFADEAESGVANLVINVNGLPNKPLNRASDGERTDLKKIEQLHIVLSDKQGRIVRDAQSGGIIKLTTASVATRIDITESGLVEGQLPDMPIRYHIGVNDMQNVFRIFIVANYVDLSGQLADIPASVQTVTDLMNLQSGIPNDPTICPMFAEAEVDKTSQPTDHGHGIFGHNYKATLVRTMAMVTVKMVVNEASEQNGGLKNGLVITPKSVRLYNVPTHCPLRTENKDIETGFMKDGGYINTVASANWKQLCNAATWTAIGNAVDDYHAYTPYLTDDMPESARTFFMLENMKSYKATNGDASGNVSGGQKDKKPQAGKENYYSYIEVEAGYIYRKTLIGDGTAYPNVPELLEGTIRYRFYLGEDHQSFNIKRNCNYLLTLRLSGWAGLVENGIVTDDNYTDKGDNYDGSSADVSWRVDTNLGTQGGFVTDGTDFPVGGSRVDIPIKISDELNRQFDKLHINLDWKGNSTTPVKIRNYAGAWQNAIDFKFSDLFGQSNSTGEYVFQVYIRPWTFNPADVKGSINGVTELPINNTLESWLTNGRRDISFTLSGNGNVTFDVVTVTQWLPLPVYPNGIPTNPNPRTASWYYDRFDVLYGSTLPWASSFFNASDLRTTANGGIWNTSKPGSFDATNGFHNTVALLTTGRAQTGQNLNSIINFNDATPTSMMEYAVFESANADPNDVTDYMCANASDVRTMRRYGLASKEEWTQIEMNGVKDPSNPLLPYNIYWTSSITPDGKKSYAYRYGGGGTALEEERTVSHVGRMVYRPSEPAVTFP